MNQIPKHIPFPHIFKIHASAGSGKTYQLTLRYLSILSYSSEVSLSHLRSIIAITFTNKAASEMKERIIQALKEIVFETERGRSFSRETGLTANKAEKWLNLILNHYGDFQVRTIDSLIFTLLRGISLEHGLRPDLDVELKEKRLLFRALDRLLLELSEGNREIEGLFRKVISTFMSIEDRSGFNPEWAIKKRMVELFRKKGKDPIKVSKHSLPDFSVLRNELNSSGKMLVERLKNEGLSLKRNAEKYFESPTEYLSSKSFYKDSITELIRGKNAGSMELEDLYTRFKNALEKYLMTGAILKITPYIDLYRKINEQLDIIRQEEGLISGGEWLYIVKNYLREGGLLHIYCKLGNRFRHFLIDEFQDTSREQWEALEPLIENSLSEGGSLTYVGDIKQSIYIWRGSDPDLFKEVPNRLPQASKVIDHNLEFNWRSGKEIVKFNNSIFYKLTDKKIAQNIAAQLLYGKKEIPKESHFVGILRDKIISHFSDVLQKIPQKESSLPGEIEIYYIEEKDKSEREEHIKSIIEEKVSLLFEETNEEIAILVRRNDQAQEVAAWLFENGIPAITENALKLNRSPLIRSIVSLLCFLNSPSDDVGLAGFLQSDLLRELIAPEDITEAIVRWQKGKNLSLYNRVRHLFPHIEKEILSPLLEMVGMVSPYDLIQYIMELFHIRERFPHEKGFLNRFLELIIRHEEEEGGSLSGFLELWKESGSDERLGLPEGIHAVKILTIHGAKGLEFSTVLIPFTDWYIKPKNILSLPDGTVLYVSKPYPKSITPYVMEERIKNAIELLNLLYVAMTRAKERIILFISKTSRYGMGDILKELLT